MLRLKLEMLYHNLPVEEAKVTFAELGGAVPVPAPVVEAPKRRRRVVPQSSKGAT